MIFLLTVILVILTFMALGGPYNGDGGSAA